MTAPIESLDEILSKFAIQILGTYTGATAFGTDGFNAKQALEAYITEQVRLARIDLAKSLKSIEYTPSGKEYHFKDGSWTNSLTDNRIAQLQTKEEV